MEFSFCDESPIVWKGPPTTRVHRYTFVSHKLGDDQRRSVTSRHIRRFTEHRRRVRSRASLRTAKPLPSKPITLEAQVRTVGSSSSDCGRVSSAREEKECSASPATLNGVLCEDVHVLRSLESSLSCEEMPTVEDIHQSYLLQVQLASLPTFETLLQEEGYWWDDLEVLDLPSET